ncbi:histidine phosphatase family protein [Candidatus Uhrbacteria bacterium]|nr:histidine phosphatase family protein [Candidatus Uhrbacteria bacterium]
MGIEQQKGSPEVQTQRILVTEGENAKKKIEQYALSLKSQDVEPNNRTLPIHFFVDGDKTLFVDQSAPSIRAIEVEDPSIAREMKEIFAQFKEKHSPSPALDKKSKKGRAVSLSLIRHGEAADQSKEAQLSEKGRLQAEIAAYQLLFNVWSKGGGVVKLYHSPTLRAKQTFDIIQKVAERVTKKQKENPVTLYKPRMRKQVEAAGVIGPLMKAGIPYKDTVDHWIKNPKVVEGKSPSDVFATLKPFLEVGQTYAHELPSVGPRIFQVAVTHEVPQAALLHTLSGKTLEQIGGGIRNGEFVNIDFNPAQPHAKVHFRQADYALPLGLRGFAGLKKATNK